MSKIEKCHWCKSKDIYQPDIDGNAFCLSCNSFQPIEEEDE